MNRTRKVVVIVMLFGFISLIGCKSQSDLETSAPFTIEEKMYFYWVGGKQGTEGTTIRIEGSTTSLNLSFSKIYFQNHEYVVVPNYRGEYFILEGTQASFRQPEQVLSGNKYEEYGNQPPQIEKKIPFDLKDDEAIILYSVSGREGYHKVSNIKQLEKVYRP